MKKVFIIGFISTMILIYFSKPFVIQYRNTDTIINKVGCLLFEFNQFDIQVEDDLTKEYISIYQNVERAIFINGEKQKQMAQDYGHCMLSVSYEGLLVAEFGHFKKNNWFSNDYEIILSKNQENIELDYKIEGAGASYDSFQKRYVYDEIQNLLRIEYLSRDGDVYNVEEF